MTLEQMQKWSYCRKVDPFQGLRVDSRLTLGNELSNETHMLIKQETLLGRHAWVESSRRTPLSRGLQSQVLWWWGEFLGCLWPVILPGSSLVTWSLSCWCTCLSAKMDSSVRVSGGLARLLPPPFGPSWTLPLRFRWQHLILCSDLLCETTQAGGCPHAWPKWAGFVDDSLTIWLEGMVGLGFVKLHFPPSSNLVWILERTFGESFRRALRLVGVQNLQTHQQCHHWMKLLSFTGSSLVVQMIKNLPAMQETQVWSLSWEDPLEGHMATRSSILAWKVPRTEEPGGL